MVRCRFSVFFHNTSAFCLKGVGFARLAAPVWKGGRQLGCLKDLLSFYNVIHYERFSNLPIIIYSSCGTYILLAPQEDTQIIFENYYWASKIIAGIFNHFKFLLVAPNIAGLYSPSGLQLFEFIGLFLFLGKHVNSAL